LDPAQNDPLINLFTPVNVIVRYRSKGEFERRERERLALFQFDLKRPLPEQIRAAERHLNRLQKDRGPVPEGRRRQISKWPKYLQVIDARDDGATYEEIGETLIGADPTASQGEYDKLTGLEPKVWAKAQHERALEVAFNFPT